MDQQTIAKAIIERLNEEKGEYVKYPAIGRCDVKLQGQPKVMWLTESEDHGSVQFVQGITGAREIAGFGQKAVLKQMGQPNIYKNSIVGEILIRNGAGKHKYRAPKGEIQIEILNKATYRPAIDVADAMEGVMKLKGQSNMFRWHSLREWLRSLMPAEPKQPAQPEQLLRSKHTKHTKHTEHTEQPQQPEATVLVEKGVQDIADEQIAAGVFMSDEEQDRELERLIAQEEADKAAALEAEKAVEEAEPESDKFRQLYQEAQRAREAAAKSAEVVKRNKMQRQAYIRTSQELRVQHILDPIQEGAKRDHIFDDHFVVIEGGPGTGKTTTLIQRIKFLTARTIEEYFIDQGRPFTDEMRALLFQSGAPWLFISPSRLLKDYLKQAMSAENLSRLEENVEDWPTLKNKLLRKYNVYGERKLLQPMKINMAAYRPYLFQRELRHYRRMERAFTEFFLLGVWRRADALATVKWKSDRFQKTADQICTLIAQRRERFGGESTLLLFHQLRMRYEEFGRTCRTDGKAALDARIEAMMGVLDRDPGRGQQIEEMFEATAVEKNAKPLSDRIHEQLGELLKKTAREALGMPVKWTERESALVSLLPELRDWSGAKVDVVVFLYGFVPLTAGIRSNVLDALLPAYRKFRTTEAFRAAIRKRSLDMLDLLISKGNKELHPEEEAFLLGYINRMVRRYRRVLPAEFEAKPRNDRHAFQNGYLDAIRPVIAVDEAADFSVIDLDCMASLRHPLLSSMTLCGDLMQRTTAEGLTSWDELNSALSRRVAKTGDFVEVYPLAKSYRQSDTILTIAKRIYRHQLGKEAPYVAHQHKSPFEPSPRLIAAADVSSRIEAVAETVAGITEDYASGIVPTIAVFVPAESDVQTVAQALREEDAIQRCGIPIEACTNGRVIGDTSAVRVFSVEFIKGLEFEAVIFHDFDRLSDHHPADIVSRLLYVGLSRAAYHLYLTTAAGLPPKLDYLADLFESWTPTHPHASALTPEPSPDSSFGEDDDDFYAFNSF